MKAFQNVHPLITAVYFLALFLITMFTSDPIIELLSLSGAILFCMTLTDKREKISDLRFYIPIFILITLTNPLFSHNGKTPLFFMNGNAVTKEAIIYGMALAGMIISVMLWFKGFSYVMTSDKLIYLFGRLIPKISLVISVALRYIPMLKRRAREVNRAQKAMGLYSSDSYADRLRSVMRVMSVLIGWSLENAVETGKSMRSRGYGLKGRTNYHNYKFRRFDAVVSIICALFLGLALSGYANASFDFSYYPEPSGIDLSAIGIVAYVGFFFFAYLPFFIELEENIRWNYCKSKI